MVNWNSIFNLCPNTYTLSWKFRTNYRLTAGAKAGTVGVRGYIQTKYKRKHYRAHRIIWEMLNGPIPEGMEIDHIDGNTSNNFPGNLRLANRSQNCCNTRLGSNNTTGIKGLAIKKDKQNIYYYAQIRCAGKIHRKLLPYSPKGRLDGIEWLDNMRNNLHKEFANNG